MQRTQYFSILSNFHFIGNGLYAPTSRAEILRRDKIFEKREVEAKDSKNQRKKQIHSDSQK